MKRIISILLLSFMAVSLLAPIIPYYGENITVKSETIIVQEDLITGNERIVNYKILQKNENKPKSDFDIALEEMNQKMSEIESIEDKREWFCSYKCIIEEYSYILDPPETIYDYFSEEELDLLFRVVQAEVGDEYSFEQKVNVAEVIFNRLEHERFPDTLLEILTTDQFQTVANENYKNVEVSESTILACEYAFQIGTEREKCLFFDSNNTLNYEFVYDDDAHNFYKYSEDEINE